VNYLEAHQIVASFTGGPALKFLFATSGIADKIDVFLRAAAARQGRGAEISTLPFNTLSQALLSGNTSGDREVFVLFPWDLVPEADWRSGVPAIATDVDGVRSRASQSIDRLAQRERASTLYVRAPMPPLFSEPSVDTKLDAWLASAMADAGHEIIPADFFSLSSYLASGSPFASRHLGALAERVIGRAAGVRPGPKKVLVTDLDNVMWRGVIGEDGLEGIHCSPEGAGFRHFVYQTMLAKLKREGALLAAVSRNDDELANTPFKSGRMVLQTDDFVAIVATYKAKSAQIREIANKLNLGLDSFVFVDDNPIELGEVASSLPDVRTVRFPDADDALPDLLSELGALFARDVVTAEDADRTTLYRRRLESMASVDGPGADLTEFLRALGMSLTVHDRSTGDRTRAVQLINKTNQFNLNGRRVTDEEVDAMLSSGGRLYTCSLSDRTGSHGEILSCLIDAEGTIRSFVMSCRVFQRRVEIAFVTWLAGQEGAPVAFDYVATSRNEPIRQFLEDGAFNISGVTASGLVSADLAAFVRAHAEDLDLFSLAAPNRTTVQTSG
jgi:FkbH-like protein